MVLSVKSAVKPSKRSRVLVRKETTAAYLFLLPSLIFFLDSLSTPSFYACGPASLTPL